MITFQVTLHQGAIEAIFLDSLASMGVTVDRPIEPTSIELSTDEGVLRNPHSHAVKVTPAFNVTVSDFSRARLFRLFLNASTHKKGR